MSWHSGLYNGQAIPTVFRNKSVYINLQIVSLVLLPYGLFFFEALPSILVICFASPLLVFGHTLQINQIIQLHWPYFLLYVILLISGFWSSDSGQWITLLRVNLPYLVLPLAFSLWPKYLWARQLIFQRHFMWAGTALTLYMVMHFIPNMDAIIQSIRAGNPFPVPVHHVRTSLFLALAGLFAWNQLHHWTSMKPVLRNSTCLCLVLIVLGIHLLAVRTGIILFYIGTVLTFILNKQFHSKRGLYLGTLFVVTMGVAIVLTPTLHEKWNYFLEDLHNYNSTSWWFYSDAMRWRTNLAGWEIFQNNPWWGVGMGDLFKDLHMWFYLNENVRIWEYPHNLWITFLAGSGIGGFLLLNLSLGKLSLKLWRKSAPVYQIIMILYLVSCMVENTLLTSLGCISFICLMLLAIENDETADAEPHPPQN